MDSGAIAGGHTGASQGVWFGGATIKMLSSDDYRAVDKENFLLDHLQLVPVSGDNVDQVRMINGIIFPLKYQDRFYRQILDHGTYCRLIFWKKELMGSFCCRMDPNERADDFIFYLMTFGVMPNARRLGIGRWMLRMIVEEGRRRRISTIRLHVHVGNQEALRFYLKRGFKQLSLVPNYYRRLTPPDAYLLESNIV